MKVTDHGLQLVLDTRTDLTQFLSGTLKIQRPDSSVGLAVLDGSNVLSAVPPATVPTRIAYQLAPGDLTVPGLYRLEIVNTTGGAQMTSEATEVYVGAGF